MSDNYNEGSLIRTLWSRMLGKTHGGKRDRYDVFGWPKAVRVEDFVNMYHRNGVASRIVRAFPQATWSEVPHVYDDSKEGESDTGSFAEAWEALEKDLKICHYLERADRLSGIGQYGLLYLGFADSAELTEPVQGNAPLLYLSAYGEHSVTVQQWDMDARSPRFGLPNLYTIQTGRSTLSTKASATKAITVHHSRVLHLSEFLDDDEVYGVPRLLPAFNYLSDLEKVTGSSAETFWLAANRGILWSADSDAEFDPDDLAKMKEQADEYEHQLRRNMTGTGLKATVLGSDTPDPKPNAEVLIQLIAGTYGMPQRLLTGSERGELASGQDSTNWAAQIDDRRNNYVAPRVLRPLIEILVDTGNLPKPQGTFTVGWDPTASLSEKEQAEIAEIRGRTLQAYLTADGADLLVPPREFRVEMLGLPEESEYEETELDLPEDDADVQAGFGGPAPTDPDEGDEGGAA